MIPLNCVYTNSPLNSLKIEKPTILLAHKLNGTTNRAPSLYIPHHCRGECLLEFCVIFEWVTFTRQLYLFVNASSKKHVFPVPLSYKNVTYYICRFVFSSLFLVLPMKISTLN